MSDHYHTMPFAPVCWQCEAESQRLRAEKAEAENATLRKDAELGRIALGFVDRAGDTDADIDSAETICREFYLAMAAAIEAARGK